MKQEDSERLDWLLLDSQPDAIGGYDIWDRVDMDGEEEEIMARYLRAARRCIDATRGALTETP